MPIPPVLRSYEDLAAWWPLISPAEEYEEEAAFAGTLLGRPPSPSVRCRPPRQIFVGHRPG